MSRPIYIVFRLGDHAPAVPYAIVQAATENEAIEVLECRYEAWARLPEGQYFWATEAAHCTPETRADAVRAQRALFEANVERRALDVLSFLANNRRRGLGRELAQVVVRWPENVRRMQDEELRFYAKALEVES